MNVMLSAAAMNFKRVMNLWVLSLKFFIEKICFVIIKIFCRLFGLMLKPTF